MPNTYHRLEKHFQKLAQIEHALTFLQWDHMVMMPPGGNHSRAKAIAELTAVHHGELSSDETGELLHQAKDKASDPVQKRSIIEMERSYMQAVCLPSALVKAKSLAATKCEHGWRSQRMENDWDSFLKNFKEVVNLCRQEAQARFDCSLEKVATPYDALLDLYCTGDKSDFIGTIFAELKNNLPTMVRKIEEKQSNHVEIQFPKKFDSENQKNLCIELMHCLGFDFNNGRLDVSSHPFSTGCRGDHRITTRFKNNDFFDSLLATAHESGHAAYEAGLPSQWDDLPIGQARNLCIHESQSLLFEKLIFLTTPFFDYFTQKIHSHLPSTTQLNSTQLRQAATKVKPSFIRIEADEATYPLHVVLRFEIEKDLINSTLEPQHIPEVWDLKMQQYLGLSTAGDYKNGCLQDMHWTDGTFGYFPSYTMGAINSAQIFQTIRSSFPNWADDFRKGKIIFLLEWLKGKIWSKGSSMDSQEILLQATGEKTNPEYLLQHLRNRYLLDEY